jgi:hypothetical protein
MQLKTVLLTVLLLGLAFAQAGGTTGTTGINTDNPAQTACGNNGGLKDVACNLMVYLLELGPIVAVIALVLGGVIYIYANVFVTADQRGRYHTLATNLVIGALLLAALVGGAGILVKSGMGFLKG